MNDEKKAKLFLWCLTLFIGASVLWVLIKAVLGGDPAEITRGGTAAPFCGVFIYFLWKRNNGVRLFLGYAFAVTGLMFLCSSLVGSLPQGFLAYWRMWVAMLFGIAMIIWRPLRNYTRPKMPNHSPEPAPGAVH